MTDNAYFTVRTLSVQWPRGFELKPSHATVAALLLMLDLTELQCTLVILAAHQFKLMLRMFSYDEVSTYRKIDRLTSSLMPPNGCKTSDVNIG